MAEIGYSDWQRVVDWDSPTIYSDSVEHTAGQTTASGALDVRRFHGISITLTPTIETQRVEIIWYQESALANIIGSRRFFTSPLMPSRCQCQLVNLGPIVQVKITCLGERWRSNVLVTASNRQRPTEVIPTTEILHSILNGTIEATTTTTAYAQSYFSGPVSILYSDIAARVSFTIEVLTEFEELSFRPIFVRQPGAESFSNETIVLPLGPIRTKIANANAVPTRITYVVIASTTGGT